LKNAEMHGGMHGGMGHMKKGFGVKRAFGEPIKVNDEVTIIPVARVKMSGGGGGGEEMQSAEPPAEGEAAEESKPKGQGSGYGFMGGVKPVGYIKIKGSCVKFHRIHDWEHIAKMMVPLGVIFLVMCKHKMMHMKMGQMHGGAPWMGPMMGPKMMHKHAHGHCGHQHHAHKMMGKGTKPPDWRAKKMEWKKHGKAGCPC